MSPLCLCYGANAKQQAAKPSCCHAPEGAEPAPCPHCDQIVPIAATAPEEGDFSANPPEWHGFDQFIGVDLFDALRVFVATSPKCGDARDFEPPPRPFCERYGVFLI